MKLEDRYKLIKSAKGNYKIGTSQGAKICKFVVILGKFGMYRFAEKQNAINFVDKLFAKPSFTLTELNELHDQCN